LIGDARQHGALAPIVRVAIALCCAAWLQAIVVSGQESLAQPTDTHAPPVAPVAPSAPANKLTFAYYHFSSDRIGGDINLRHSFTTSTAWVGVYSQSDDFTQVRAGYEYDYRHRWISATPSGQLASHGFAGATIYAEVGRPVFAIVGAGRTNLKPYWNLGFDPNDYVQFGAGVRDRAGSTVSVYAIHDNRLDTGQTNTHLVARKYLPDEWRLTLDVVREDGNDSTGVVVRGWGASVDVDWRRWFVRVASDPHVNYTTDSQLRVAGGLRF
jgi:hypothetical protein